MPRPRRADGDELAQAFLDALLTCRHGEGSQRRMAIQLRTRLMNPALERTYECARRLRQQFVASTRAVGA